LLLSSQGLFSFSYWSADKEAEGCTRSWDGAQPGQLTQTSQRDIPYDMTSCLKTWRKLFRGTLWPGECLDIIQHVISICTVHHLFCIFFY